MEVNQSAPWSEQQIHIVGVAGAGMSGLAILAAGLGARVTGSDRNPSLYLEAVRAAGVTVNIGAEVGELPAGTQRVVSSTAIPFDDPQREQARALAIPDESRHDLLGAICNQYRVVAVAGAHGKTTTSAMTVVAMQAAGIDVSYLVGGVLANTGKSAHSGSSPWLVIEADESDGSFLRTNPEVAVVTNIEFDVHGSAGFKGEVDLGNAFGEFLSNGQRRLVWEAQQLDNFAQKFAATARYGVKDFRTVNGEIRFLVEIGGTDIALSVRQPGIHTAWNAAAALNAAVAAGANVELAANGLANFAGTGRRFEEIGMTRSGARVVDDYAHHPTEVRHTLQAAKSLKTTRVVAIFQPHLFSRTKKFQKQFGQALAIADQIFVVDIYPAREKQKDFPGLTGLNVARAAASANGGTVTWLPDFSTAAETISAGLRNDDLVLTLGAGNVYEIARSLVS